MPDANIQPVAPGPGLNRVAAAGDLALGLAAFLVAGLGVWVLANIVQTYSMSLMMVLSLFIASLFALGLLGLGAGLIWLAWQELKSRTSAG